MPDSAQIKLLVRFRNHARSRTPHSSRHASAARMVALVRTLVRVG
jgi:hypothetical protein